VWCVVCGVWCVVCGVWCVWCVVCGVRCAVQCGISCLLMIHVLDSLPLHFLALLVDELGVLSGEAIDLERECLLRSSIGRVQDLEVAGLVRDVGWVGNPVERKETSGFWSCFRLGTGIVGGAICRKEYGRASNILLRARCRGCIPASRSRRVPGQRVEVEAVDGWIHRRIP